MKVGGSSQATSIGASARRTGATAGFALGGVAVEPAKTAGAASETTGVAGIDVLLMLQEPEDATTRRRRAVRRADSLLDRLDALRLAALGEGDAGSALQRLTTALRAQRSEVDDPALADILDAVETRAAVELAKREVRATA